MTTYSCPSCGAVQNVPAHLMGNAVACQKCGADFTTSLLPARVQPFNPSTATRQRRSRSKPATTHYVVVILAFVLMAGLTALVIGLGRGGAKRGVAGQGNQQAVEAAFTKGHYHYKRREYAAAISHFDNAIGLMPRFARGYRMRGKTYRRLGEPDKAISDFCRAIELEPENADAFSDRALAYLDKSRTAISKSASQSYLDAFERDRKWSNELIRKQSLAPVPRNR